MSLQEQVTNKILEVAKDLEKHPKFKQYSDNKRACVAEGMLEATRIILDYNFDFGG